MAILRFFELAADDDAKTAARLEQLQKLNKHITSLKIEKCFHIETKPNWQFTEKSEKTLMWILKRPQEKNNLTRLSSLNETSDTTIIIEIGPRFNFSTANSSNSVSICANTGMDGVIRLETSVRYLIGSTEPLPEHVESLLIDTLGDRMTQCRYTKDNLPEKSFDEQLYSNQEAWYHIPLLEEGRNALKEVNVKLGLAFDDWDIDFYDEMFRKKLKRNPTSVELFDCAQSNSEHSRHWFFKGQMIIDGVPQKKSLIEMICDTQQNSNKNNTIKFSDNSSAIKGYDHKALRPTKFDGPSEMKIVTVESDLIFTAETHNMPTAVAPFSGATTGTGGRIRDVQGVGRGGLTIAGTAGYCVGSLNIPGYPLTYDLKNQLYPGTFAKPLDIIIEASNGASDYGNKFGEPVISGFAISYGCINAAGERDEYVKPIMFSGGMGIMDASQSKKEDPKKGMLLAKIGGPVYRIGVGGGAASSVEVQGDNESNLDFNAVQRGDAEMENKLNRVVRACIEMGNNNPILAIHDQGAGGNGNVLKELVEPGFAGAVIFSKEFKLGDPTIVALELWGAEYQENNALLCRPKDRMILEAICERERCPINFVGVVSGNGFVTFVEGEADFEKYINRDDMTTWGDLPFDMHLKDVLGEMPRRKFLLSQQLLTVAKLNFDNVPLDLNKILYNVMSVLSVGSKRFLTNKVDRCVTGLIAQQQCVGPLHTPLADYAVTAVSHFGFEGIATSIGTQPSKGLISARAGARMSVAEAISNLVFVKISNLEDVKCSGNWMWAAKLPSEGTKMYHACQAMCEMMGKLGIAIDGGKDSLSMAARVKNQVAKSPGTLVISTYVQCPDIRCKVTPDLKEPAKGNEGCLIWINIEKLFRLGGSAFAQSLGQQGNDFPDVSKPELLQKAFKATQKLLEDGYILSGHDISDGGLIVCLIEMAIAGMCGLSIDLTNAAKTFEFESMLHLLFSEEIGWILEVSKDNEYYVLEHFKSHNVPAYNIGSSIGYGLNSNVSIALNGRNLITGSTLKFLKEWERTSFEIEKLQMDLSCAQEEYKSFDTRTGPKYHCTFNPDAEWKVFTAPNKVAVIREEGSNGDREMISTLMAANFVVYDVTMSDLLAGKTSLDQFRGIVFPGGFSYSDTLGSAKGWAASILYSDVLRPQFEHFKNRQDSFSLGICNGCQLMSLIGWVGNDMDDNKDVDVPNVALLHNKSSRYECRWVSVKIAESKSIMLRNMAGSVLGCWVAHGEGNLTVKSEAIMNNLKANQCIAAQYVDDQGNPTEVYPMNPNGSINGIGGICSKDGRHLALMPHPERCSIMWQWPYVPHDFEYINSPWQTMFNEAYVWCNANGQ